MDYERVVCPDSGETQKPERVWDSKLPSGERITYGIIKKHHHGSSGGGRKDGQVCPRSGDVVSVVPENKKD